MEISNLSGLEKNMEAKGDSSSHIVRVFQEQVDASLTWEFVRWMRDVTKLPIFVKVLHPDTLPSQINPWVLCDIADLGFPHTQFLQSSSYYT